ncbi:lysophospholipid acyltransferase family protein [Phocoenobacter skyensis]|uniref:1-acyl-sn-glycerol-3-phosphate acyltransferases n=1 Tax=Phocoenobacter skyensis TaxID=97481 RepID=A0A1H7X6F7_9PAST|nr:lysophospholipid acyltransferase family protein [Pasteurella skyensis]MDP8079620.1 lysophospholipid acyltransferase family protein [Pasteurella skyensis]MDP8085569.1 lysophospholipid acyltransferase family protein [Pasteurella skyensis]MDP8170843.1 lysophospholipid acyltransferase family protein [Pasteurella skyensis]MDP8174949.1 lysophospholipid acyltransferase family protein [Pasteurella skyensis]MDP8185623.1 lysophospholipid acyltransferase family protein [Pasteurella skyensis]
MTKINFKHLPKVLFFALIVKPVVLFLLGLNIQGKRSLPTKSAVIAANHNSHLDTLVLMSLFPLSQIHLVRPVAAADYFLKNRYMAWFALNCIGIIPLERKSQQYDQIFKDCHQALDNGDILILFPEGSRGEPEKIGTIKKGLYYLLEERQHNVEVYPVILRGLGNALPRGEALFVPFNCDVIIGEPLPPQNSSEQFVTILFERYNQLAENCLTK